MEIIVTGRQDTPVKSHILEILKMSLKNIKNDIIGYIDGGISILGAFDFTSF
jgi:hypothetical protein